MPSNPLRALCALVLGGLSAFAQEKLHIYTFDRLPAALKAPQPRMTAGGTWAFNPSAPEAFNASSTTINRLTYEGLELNGAATTNGFVSFTYGDSQTLDLRRFSRIEVTVAGLPGNQLNPLTLELSSATGGVTRRTVFYADTQNLTRFGDKVVFDLDDTAATRVWHSDGGVPYNRAAVRTITLSSNWPASPLPARLIIRDFHAVNDTLFDPAFFPRDRIVGQGTWAPYSLPDGGRLVLKDGARALENNNFRLRYADGSLTGERDLTPYEWFTVDATPLANNASDLLVRLYSSDGNHSRWLISRGPGANRVFNLRTPNAQGNRPQANLSRVTEIYIGAAVNDGTPVRWSIGDIQLSPFEGNLAYTFRRGINISHWLSQNEPHFPFASAARFNEAIVGRIASYRRGGRPAFDHIRIPVDHQNIGKLDGTPTSPTFTLVNEKWEGGRLVQGIAPLRNAIAWARRANLGVIIDLHSLPGLSMDTSTPHFIFADTDAGRRARREAEAVWRALARTFANHGPWLRFELMNEPVWLPVENVDSNTRVASVQEDLRRVVRESHPNRVIYLAPNNRSNRESFWGLQLSQPRYPSFNVRPWRQPLPGENVAFREDKNVAYTIHYYDPLPLTHYHLLRDANDRPVYTTPLGADALIAALGVPGRTGTITDAFSRLRWDLINPATANHYLLEYREVHVGEFGISKRTEQDHQVAYRNSPLTPFRNARYHFMRRVRNEAELRGYAWCAWDHLDSDISAFDTVNGVMTPNTAGEALINP